MHVRTGLLSTSWPWRLAPALALVAACSSPPSSSGRPTLSLSAADRTPDPSCGGTWVAGMTSRVVDQNGRAIVGARVQPCLVYGNDRIGTCLDGELTNAQGWVGIRFEGELRCSYRVVLRVTADASYAAAYQVVDLTPNRAVLDVPRATELHQLTRATSVPPLGTPTAARDVTFADGVVINVIPDAIDVESEYPDLAMTLVRGADAPEFLHAHGEPALAIAFGPDNDLTPLGTSTANRWGTVRMPAPAGAADGTSYDVYVLGGLFTFDNGTQIEEGDLHRLSTVSVTGGQLTFPLARVGWYALVRR